MVQSARLRILVIFATLMLVRADTEPEPMCVCGDYIGTFCSDRAVDGSNLLKGECEQGVLYRCAKAHGEAEMAVDCSECRHANEQGADRCGL